jgi:hypothetical protein
MSDLCSSLPWIKVLLEIVYTNFIFFFTTFESYSFNVTVSFIAIKFYFKIIETIPRKLKELSSYDIYII